MKYFLLEGKSEIGTLFFRVVKRKPELNMRVSTGIKVEVNAWKNSQKSVSAWNRYSLTAKGKDVAEKLSAIDEIVAKLLADGKIQTNDDKCVIVDAVSKVVNANAIRIEQKQKGNILDFYEDFVVGITANTIRHGGGEKYGNRTIMNWKGFKKYLYAYCSKEATFDDIDKRFADGFVAYLDNVGLMQSSIQQYKGMFCKLCNLSAEYGINKNATSLRVWKVQKTDEAKMKTEIYLTEEELDAIYTYPFSAKDCVYRDVFILGCLSCQRFSDYSKFRKEDFEVLDNGITIIKVKQAKTGKYVEVPIVDKRFAELCRKYKYQFPVVSLVYLDSKIKAILKKVASVCSSLNDEYVTQLSYKERLHELNFVELQRRNNLNPKEKQVLKQMLEYAKEHDGKPLYKRNKQGEVIKYKWELVSSHTARRSGITNMVKQGLLDTREMMSISGHSTEKIFNHYIKMGTREQVERIAEKLLSANGQGKE